MKSISQICGDRSVNRFIIIGGGIVGAGIAAHLGIKCPSVQILLIDASLSPLVGSTGLAPGFVGQVNEIDLLTELAIESVRQYSLMPNAFAKVGGLEISASSKGIETLKKRAHLADKAGLRARIISSEEAASLAPRFHQPDGVSSALHFMDDGIADAKQITAEYRKQAHSRGIAFIEAKVISIGHENGNVSGVETSGGFIKASRVVVATGIWTSMLLKALGINLPILPVAHPYVQGQMRPSSSIISPFVRYPEHHIYARDHGSFDGFGSYDHRPIFSEMHGPTATGPWLPDFDEVVLKAMEHFPRDGDSPLTVGTVKAINGVFAMTPDSLPLVGEINDFKGLYVAAGIWITHAGAAASIMANIIAGEEIDRNTRVALDPNRFFGEEDEVLREKAMGLYNDIWNLENH